MNMGKQYNFYIDSALEEKFVEYLFENDYRLYSFHLKKLVCYSNDKILKSKGSSLCIFCIHKEAWGKMPSEISEVVLRERCPIITYKRPSVDIKRKTISRGRLFLETRYKNEIDNFEIVNDEYNKLVKWLRKEVQYKDYRFKDGKKSLFPISQAAVDLVEEGYRLKSY